MSDILRSNKKIYIHIIYNSREKNSTPTHATTVLLWNQEQWWIPSILMNYNSSDGSIVCFRFWLQIKREKRAIIYERAVSIMIWTDFKEKIGKLIRRNIHRKYHRVYRRMQENEKSNIGTTYINNLKKKAWQVKKVKFDSTGAFLGRGRGIICSYGVWIDTGECECSRSNLNCRAMRSSRKAFNSSCSSWHTARRYRFFSSTLRNKNSMFRVFFSFFYQWNQRIAKKPTEFLKWRVFSHFLERRSWISCL